MADYRNILRRVQEDPLYERNLGWGRPRAGHPEGTLQAHIEQLEANLARIRPELRDGEEERLRILVHVHDICKPQAATGVVSDDPSNHGYMASQFLALFCDDPALLKIAQRHDDGYMLYNYFRHSDELPQRLRHLLVDVLDPELFLLFACVDGCTPGKVAQPLAWFLEECDRVSPLSKRLFRCHHLLRWGCQAGASQ